MVTRIFSLVLWFSLGVSGVIDSIAQAQSLLAGKTFVAEKSARIMPLPNRVKAGFVSRALETIQQAKQLKLHQHTVWRRLLLYKPRGIGGSRSQIDDPDFFLSPSGKTDPWAELRANLLAFQHQESLPKLPIDARCRFPARFWWLNQQLHFLKEGKGLSHCARLREFRLKMQPATLTVVFPTPYAGHLASLFGHLLLRFDPVDRGRSVAMLNTVVSFSAQIPDAAHFSQYIFRGLSGGYPGSFSARAYHEKIKQYAQIENRDLWEYTLDLTDAQMQFIFLHTFELLGVRADFYFLKENCSYHLLSLLEVAVPNLSLTDSFDFWTVPIDAVKLLQRHGLVRAVNYVPALKTKIDFALANLTQAEYATLKSVKNSGGINTDMRWQALSMRSQVRVLDLLIDLSPDLGRQAFSGAKGEVATVQHLLQRRSQIPLPSAAADITQPAYRPDQGHHAARVSVSSTQQFKRNVYDLAWRAGYHDQLDASVGHSNTAFINVLDLRVRHDPKYSRTRLQQFTLFDLRVLRPRTPFYSKLSWRVAALWQRDERPGQTNSGQTRFKVALGLSYSMLKQRAILYSFADLGLEYAGTYRKGYRIRPGATLGLTLDLSNRFRLALECSVETSLRSDNLQGTNCQVRQNFALAQSAFVRLWLGQNHFAGQQSVSIGLAFGFYY